MLTNLLIAFIVLSGSNVTMFVGAVGIVCLLHNLSCSHCWGWSGEKRDACTVGLIQWGFAPALGDQNTLQHKAWFAFVLKLVDQVTGDVVYINSAVPSVSCNWCKKTSSALWQRSGLPIPEAVRLARLQHQIPLFLELCSCFHLLFLARTGREEGISALSLSFGLWALCETSDPLGHREGIICLLCT